MARSSTTFTRGDPRAIAARKRHGAKSQDEVRPRAERIYRRLRYGALRDLSAKQLPALRLLASVTAKRELLDEHYERSGLIGGKRLDPSTAFYGECARLELALMERLGLTSIETEPDVMLALQRLREPSR